MFNLNNKEMKIHFIKKYYYTGDKKTHFKTVCGKIRHIFTNLRTAHDKTKVTCMICNHRQEYNEQELKLFIGKTLRAFELFLHDEYGENVVSGSVNDFLKLHRISQ